MYNSEQKESFIKSYTHSLSNIKFCYTLFNQTEKYEREYKKDVACFNINESQELLDSVAGVRRNINASRIVVLRKYVRWCLDNNIPRCTGDLLNVKTVGMNTIRQRMVANPKMLSERLAMLFDKGLSENDINQSLSNIYKAYYWMAFMGIPEEELLNVRDSEVNFWNKVIRHNNLNYQIYPESLQTFSNCVNNTQFVFVHSNYLTGKSNLKDRYESDILLRGFREPSTPMVMRAALSRINKKNNEDNHTNIQLSYIRVYLSGVFYKKYIEEMTGNEVSFKSEAEQLIKIREQYEPISDEMLAKKIYHKEWEYFEDYNRWKVAFGLL